MRYILIVILFLSCNSNSQTTTVYKVHDGDTFYTIDNKKIRLADVDCPELEQPYGIDAKHFTENFVLHKRVKIIKVGYDKKWDRDVCQVYVNGIWLNKALVDAGLGWAYKGMSTLYGAELAARNKQIGLWSTTHIPPFKFRKQ